VDKKVLSALFIAIIAFGLATAALAADSQTVYLTGTGKDFEDTCTNMFFLGGSGAAKDPNVWHLSYSGSKPGLVTEMHVAFTNGREFIWDPTMGFSKNSKGINIGWVIAAPFGWEIDYTTTDAGSFVTTNEAGKISFTVSGSRKGSLDTGKGYYYDFWAAISITADGSGGEYGRYQRNSSSTSSSVTMPEASNRYILPSASSRNTSQSYYIKVEGDLITQPAQFVVANRNGRAIGRCSISVADDGQLVININGLSIRDGNDSLKIMVSNDETWFTTRQSGAYPFVVSGSTYVKAENEYEVSFDAQLFQDTFNLELNNLYTIK